MPDITTLLSKFLADLYAGTLGVTNPITSIVVADGTAAAAPIGFLSSPSSGLFMTATPTFVGAASAGTCVFGWRNDQMVIGSAIPFGWSSGTPGINGQDTVLTRVSAGVMKLAHGTATSTVEIQASGGSGGFISTVKALTELTTIAAAATTPTTIQIPANAVVLGVSVRVVTVIPTAATFTVTSATPSKTWNTVAVPVAATTTDPGTAPGPTFQTTASVITITPNLTPGTGTGQVRVTIFYYTITPPTS